MHAGEGIYKRITADTVGRDGTVFAEAVDVTSRGGGLTKVAGTRHPEVERFLRTLRPDPAYQYVLMAPMGSFEYWGRNANGDVFPEVSLAYDLRTKRPESVIRELVNRYLAPFGKQLPPGDYWDFGYQTFRNANRYLHHVNKDTEISYGSIPLAVWNPAMHRVEVIVRHDREKAKRVGASDVITDIDMGKPRQISMGCRVPFDVCTICGAIARTPAAYCEHLSGGRMGTVYADGRVAGAVNFFPRFFDLSDVIVPAAKESGVLAKVASVNYPRFGSFKGAQTRKLAEILKRVSPNTDREPETLMQASRFEQDLPDEVLEAPVTLPSLLSTLAALGVVLKPQEYQHAALSRLGFADASRELQAERRVFAPCDCASPSPSQIDPRWLDRMLLGLLGGLAPQRSAFAPALGPRVIRLTMSAPSMGDPLETLSGIPVLDKCAQDYASYRRDLRALPKLLDVAVTAYPDYYRDTFFQDALSDAMTKSASAGSSTRLSKLYVYNAFQPSSESLPASWESVLSRNPMTRALLG